MSGTESLILRMQQAMQGLRDTTRQANTEADNLRRSFSAIDAAARDAIANGFTGRGSFRNYLPQGSDDLTNLQRQQARDHAVSLINQQSPAASHHNVGSNIASVARNEASQFMRATLAAAGAASVTAFAFRGADRAVDLNVETDRLMRMSRGLAGGFDSLLGSIESASRSMHMPADEAAKLAVSLAKLGGTVDMNTMVAQVKASRAFGMEDGAISHWSAKMQWHDARDPSAMLPMIAGLAAKTGMGGKMDELLSAFEEYAGRTEKVMLHTADTAGFAVSMSALGGLKDQNGDPLPGLRGAGGAALLGALDAGWQHSGAGEAGEVARGRFLAYKGIKDPYEQKYILEKGISDQPQMLEEYIDFVRQLTGTTGGTGADDYRLADALARDFGISRHAGKALIDFKAQGGNLTEFTGWATKATGKQLSELPGESMADLSKIWKLQSDYDDGNTKGFDVEKLNSLLSRYKVDMGDAPGDIPLALDRLAKAASNGPEDTKATKHREMMADIANTQMWAGEKLLSGAEMFHDAVKEFLGDKPDPVTGKTPNETHQEYSDRSMDSPSAQARGYALPLWDAYLDKKKGKKPDASSSNEAASTVPGDKTSSLLGTVGRGVGDAIFGPSGAVSWMSGSAVAGTLPGELTPEQRGESPAATVAKVTGSGAGAGAAKLSGSKADFVARIRPAAEAAAAKLGVPADALVAQAALETGWGKSVAGNNLSGIKASKNWAGKVTNTGTQEWDGSKMVSQKDNFRAYDSYEDSFNDYANVISKQKNFAGALQSGGDPEAYFSALKAGGYATDPNYVGNLMGTMKSVQGMEGGSTAASSGGSVKWQPGVHLGTKSTDGGGGASAAAGGAVKWEPGVHLGTKSTDGGGAAAAGGDVKWEPGVHLGTKKIDDYNMQLPEGTSAAASARDAPSAVRDMLSSMGGPGGELGRMVGDMRATIDVVQKSDMGEVLSQHSRQFALGGVPQPQHMLAGAKAMMGAAQGLANGFTGAMARR